MYTAFVVLEVILALALIALVLLQQGKGADAGAAFGSGSSGTVFGAAGGASTLQKITTWLAVGFFVVTMGLSMMARDRAVGVEPAGQESVVSGRQAPVLPAEELAPLADELEPEGVGAIPSDDGTAVPDVPDIPVGGDGATGVESIPVVPFQSGEAPDVPAIPVADEPAAGAPPNPAATQ